ncbi:hypothetical protein C8R44DRAFT_749135 [Mycena epipterygia]|nr:hypothetical protein C8R44DRAFT_749135 [Mycena epipterygia]
MGEKVDGKKERREPKIEDGEEGLSQLEAERQWRKVEELHIEKDLRKSGTQGARHKPIMREAVSQKRANLSCTASAAFTTPKHYWKSEERRRRTLDIPLAIIPSLHHTACGGRPSEHRQRAQATGVRLRLSSADQPESDLCGPRTDSRRRASPAAG